MKDPERFERAREEFRRKTAHMTEAEVDAEIDRIIHLVRKERAAKAKRDT